MNDQNSAAQAADPDFVTAELRGIIDVCEGSPNAADADDPACASDLSHFANGWRACLMSQVRALVADERAAFEAKFPLPAHCQWIGNGYAASEYNAWDAHKHSDRWEGGYY